MVQADVLNRLEERTFVPSENLATTLSSRRKSPEQERLSALELIWLDVIATLIIQDAKYAAVGTVEQRLKPKIKRLHYLIISSSYNFERP
jgi:hypothetical protein